VVTPDRLAFGAGRGPRSLEPTLVIRPLTDRGVEQAGFPVDSPYVEGLWLSVLGPSATWALRRLSALAAARPEGVEVDLAEFGRSLGLGSGSGRSSVISRSIERLVTFGVAAWDGDALLVRQAVPPLSPRQLSRLSPALVGLHRRLVAPRTPEVGVER